MKSSEKHFYPTCSLKPNCVKKKSFLELLVSQKLLVEFFSIKTAIILIVANNLQPVTKILKQLYKSLQLYQYCMPLIYFKFVARCSYF